MYLASWTIMLLAAIATGQIAVLAMTAVRPAWAVVACLGMATASITSIAWLARSSPPAIIVAAAVILLGGIAGGYIGTASLLFEHLAARSGQRPEVVLTGAPGAASPLIILASDAEPERYTPDRVAADLMALRRQGAPVPADASWPLLCIVERSRYRAHEGGSPARTASREMAHDVAARLDATHAGCRVVVLWLGGWDPGDIVRSSPGHGPCVFVPLEVGSSEALTAAAETISQAARAAGRPFASLPPAAARAHTAETVASKAWATAQHLPQPTGIVLVGHGEAPTGDGAVRQRARDETYVLNRARAEIIRLGGDEALTRIAWSAWEEPDIIDIVRHLGAHGCRGVLLVPAAWPVDTLETLVDMPRSVDFARLDRGVSTRIMPAWGRDDVIVNQLVEDMRTALDGDAGRRGSV